MKQLTGKLKSKVLIGVICAVFVLAGVLLLPPLIRTAQAATSGDYEYMVNEDGTTVTITGYNGTGGDITIPDKVADGTTDYVVTVIGESAFSGKTVITGVAIPETVKSIGTNAFRNCALTSVTIPDSVTVIESSAFANCEKLVSIKLPNRINGLANNLFQGCTALTNVSISDSVNSIGSYTFSGCWALSTLEIPNSVSSIGDNAFQYSGLISIDIPDSITNIGKGTFFHCSKLNTVNLPGTTTSIGISVFEDCTALEMIMIPNNVESIGANAFKGCISLLSISIPEGTQSLGNNAFDGCVSLTSILLPESIEFYGGSIFIDCTNLINVILPENLIELPSGMFWGCSSLESIDIPAGVAIIGARAFENCASLTNVNLPGGLTEIRFEAFSGCSSFTNIEIPSGVNSVGESAFARCSDLETINIPDSLTVIEMNTFKGCTALENITIPDGVTTVNRGAFSNSGLKSVYLPDSISIISREMFSGCTSLTDVYIPDSISTIDYQAFKGCTALVSISLPESITLIWTEAFRGCTALESISLPANAKNIDQAVFMDCVKLKNVDIPNGISGIWDAAFQNCTSLESIVLPNSITNIGNGAFYNCSSLADITIPAGVHTINRNAFGNCPGLRAAYFLGNAPTYDSSPIFSNCAAGFTVYYIDGRTGFSNPWQGYPTAVFDPDITITVTFSLNGVSGTAPEAQQLFKGAKAYCPENPKKDGYQFGGWYADEDCTDVWEFHTDVVTSDITLFAKWTVNSYTVKFVSESGSIPDQTITYNAKITKPDDPSMTGYEFRGWFTDAACTDAWDFDRDTVITDMTLYAKWVDVSFAITAASNNAIYGSVTGGGTYPSDTEVTLRATPNAGCRFVCWREDATQISTNAIFTLTTDDADRSITAEFGSIGTPAVSAASGGYDRVTLTWSAVEGVAGYEIWRATSAAGAYIKVNTATATTYTDSNLTAGITYYYKVKAYCAASTATTYGSLSAYASATPVPSAPGGTVAAMTGYSSVKVSWNTVSGASGYQLYRATSQNGTYSLIKTTSSLSYTNTSLSTGRIYYYKVRAYGYLSGNKVYGSYSAIVSAKPMLSSVTTATASAYYPTSIKISWSAVSGRTRYEVWRGTTADTSKFTKIGTTSSTYYKDTTCTPFVTYYYQIKVYRTVSGQKVYSSSASPTASAKPILNNVTGVKAAMNSASSIKISWNSVTGASGYEVLRSTSPDSGFTVIKSTSSRSYTDSNRIPNTTYYYRVQAYRKVGSSRVYSTAMAASATPYFGTATNPKAVRSSSTKIKISWSAVSGRTGYEIWRSTTPDPAGFTLLKSTTSTSYTNSGLTTGVTYYYKIRAYRTVNNTRYYSAFTPVVSAKP